MRLYSVQFFSGNFLMILELLYTFFSPPRCLLHHRTQALLGSVGHGFCREFEHDSTHQTEGNGQKRRYLMYTAVITTSTLASICISHYVEGIKHKHTLSAWPAQA
jgi:hypothetical protein